MKFSDSYERVLGFFLLCYKENCEFDSCFEYTNRTNTSGKLLICTQLDEVSNFAEQIYTYWLCCDVQ